MSRTTALLSGDGGTTKWCGGQPAGSSAMDMDAAYTRMQQEMDAAREEIGRLSEKMQVRRSSQSFAL